MEPSRAYHTPTDIPEIWDIFPFLDALSPFSLDWFLDRLEAEDMPWD